MSPARSTRRLAPILLPLVAACASARADRRPVTLVPPRYPDMLQSAGVEGHVRFEVPVDAAGRPAMAAWWVVESTNDLFTAAAKSALPRWRWAPRARPGGGARPFAHTVRWVLLPADTTAPARCPASGPDTTVVCARRYVVQRSVLY